MASLQKKAGWYTLVFYREDRTPKRKRIALRTRTKEEAEKKRRQLEDDYAQALESPPSDMFKDAGL